MKLKKRMEDEGLSIDDIDNSLVGCLIYDHVANLENFFRVVLPMTRLWEWRSPQGLSVLHIAARASPKCLALLLDKGAPVNAADTHGRTPLIHAVLGGSLECALRLLAAPDVVVDAAFGSDQETALQVAVDANDVSLAQALMEHGADPTLTDAQGQSALSRASSLEVFRVLARGRHVDAALFAAVELEDVAFVECALAAGANVKCTLGKSGRTALMMAAARNAGSLCKLLLDQGALVDAVAHIKGQPRTALLYCANRNAVSSARLLLHHGATAQVSEALEEARAKGFPELVTLFEKHLHKSGAKPKQKPWERAGEELSLDAATISRLPRKWHVIGHVLLFQNVDRNDPLLRPLWPAIGALYLKCPQIRAQSVAVEWVNPHGELRVPVVECVAGRPDTLTCHKEGGVRYWLDPCRVMFSSGNGTERMHFRKEVRLAAQEVCVDMFAGIGYFSIPLALGAEPGARIVCLEKNPDSAAYLRKNVEENAVQAVVTVDEGDNREVGGHVLGQANRVLMGYIPTPVSFIKRALQFLRPEGGIIHYHYVATLEEKNTMPRQHMEQEGARVKHILNIREVKNYAPKLMHYVADVEIEQ